MNCKHDGRRTREGVCLKCGELPKETAEFIEKLRKEIFGKAKEKGIE
jgi:hypothetical protein